jgi:hypothetical protein
MGALGAGIAVAALAAILLWLLLAGGPDATPTAPPRATSNPPAPRPAEATAPDAASPAPPAFISPLVPDAAAPPEPAETKVTLEGRVVDIRDDGIEGAEVSLFLGRDLAVEPTGTLEEVVTGSVYRPLGRGAVRTGADGGFRITAPAGTVATVQAKAPDHAPACLESILFAEDRAGVLLRLESAEPFEGVVRSAAGQRPPVEGAEVRLLSGTETRGVTVLESARTDAEGKFRFAGARRGMHALLVTARGYLPQGPYRVAVPLEVDRPYEISLWPAGRATLKGTVLLPGCSGLAAGAEVRAGTRPGFLESIAETTADAKGEFALEVEVNPTLVSHLLKIEIRAGERGAVREEFPKWPGGTDERFVLEAPPSGVLRGRVVDASPGANRAGVADVAIEGGGPWIFPVKKTAVTDRQGAFVLEGLPYRKPWLSLSPGEVKVKYAAGFPAPEFLFLPEEEVVLEVVPRRHRRGTGSSGETEDVAPEVVPASVSGAVLGADGQAVPGARVWGFGLGTVIADARGAFVLSAVIPKEKSVVLRAEAPGYQPGSAGPMGVFPELELRNVAIFLPAKIHGVVGRVLDSDGAPVRGARVKATPQSGSAGGSRPAFSSYPVPTATRADGTYRFEAPAGSSWRIEASAAGFRSGAIEGVPAAGPVPDLVLVPVSAPTPR